MENRSFFFLLIGALLLAGCSPAGSKPPTPTVTPTLNLIPAATSFSTLAATPLPPVASSVCTDPQVTALIDSLKTAMLDANGELLSSLVSSNGMEVRYYRNGKVITYTSDQAKFLFETTYSADWGADPASGAEKEGSFHDVIVPELVKIFNQPYTLHCNEVKHGGASYEASWPYDKDFYSIYYPGTVANGYLDWHTWVAGIEYAGGKPYVYALMQFYWEP